MTKYDYVLFDFDGTISRSGDGVRRCIELTLAEMGRPCPDLSDYTRYIGPPLTRTFTNICGLTEQESLVALSIYHGYYRETGVRMNSLYDGVAETLTALRDAGVKMAVCTSKSEPQAGKSLRYIGADGYFDAVCGSCPDGSRKDKIELIPYAMDALGCTDPRRAVMIGDTYFDAEGAAACGIDFIGVLYGYGTRESMQAYGARDFADTPRDIMRYLL